MISKKITTFFSMTFIVVLILTACQSVTPSATANQVATAAAQTMTAFLTSTKQVTVTSTLITVPTLTLTPTITSTLTITPTATLVAYGPTGFPSNVNPLTGLPVADPSLLNRRPVMVKVSNYPATGRPHAGLSFADIVFDYGIESGTNRFLALYYGQDASKVGPIRSGRYVDAQIVPMYQGILAYGSAWEPELIAILNALGKRAVMEGDNTCPAICRDTTISKTPTVVNLFADTAALTQYEAAHGVTQQKYPLNGMAFNPNPPANGNPGTSLTVTFGPHNQMDFRYDATTGKYLVWTDSGDENPTVTMIPLVDRNTNKQLAYSNVIVMTAEYTKDFEAVYEIAVSTNFTFMPAVVYRDGKEYPALWKAVANDSPIQFFTPDKQPFELQPGNTWIVIGGQTGKMSQPNQQTDPGQWLYYFNPP
jgi:hypothetical protein